MEDIREYVEGYLLARNGEIDNDIANQAMSYNPRNEHEAREIIRELLNLK